MREWVVTEKRNPDAALQGSAFHSMGSWSLEELSWRGRGPSMRHTQCAHLERAGKACTSRTCGVTFATTSQEIFFEICSFSSRRMAAG